MLRRKFAASSCTPQIASYTARSSAIVNVVPTNAVAMPETSSSTRTRSTASRTIRRWSNASSSCSVEDVGDGDERSVRCVGAGDDRADVAKHGEVGDGHDVHARIASGVAVRAELGQQARGVDAGLLGELPLRRLVQRLVGRLKPPGIAHIPLNGSSPRRTRRTWSAPSDIVRITTSTVTANAGNADGVVAGRRAASGPARHARPTLLRVRLPFVRSDARRIRSPRSSCLS